MARSPAQPIKPLETGTGAEGLGQNGPGAVTGVARGHGNMDIALRAAAARLIGGVSQHAFMEAWNDWALRMSRAPGRQLELAEHAQEIALKLAVHAVSAMDNSAPPFAHKAHDHRFDHPGWQKAPFHMWQQSFLAIQDWWDHATAGLRGLWQEDADWTRFMMRLMLDVVSPSNFPALNPEITEKTVKKRGENLTEGTTHFSHDVLKTLLNRRDAPPEGYQIGKDLGCTPGEVVFRNVLFELIQYALQTEKVHAEPILIVPVWIMKYYILDLSPQNSMVRYLFNQGFTVFMISWCNPTAEQRGPSLEDYRNAGSRLRWTGSAPSSQGGRFTLPATALAGRS